MKVSDAKFTSVKDTKTVRATHHKNYVRYAEAPIAKTSSNRRAASAHRRVEHPKGFRCNRHLVLLDETREGRQLGALEDLIPTLRDRVGSRGLRNMNTRHHGLDDADLQDCKRPFAADNRTQTRWWSTNNEIGIKQ